MTLTVPVPCAWLRFAASADTACPCGDPAAVYRTSPDDRRLTAPVPLCGPHADASDLVGWVDVPEADALDSIRQAALAAFGAAVLVSPLEPIAWLRFTEAPEYVAARVASGRRDLYDRRILLASGSAAVPTPDVVAP